MTLATALGSERPSQPVTSSRLGKASISGCAFENPLLPALLWVKIQLSTEEQDTNPVILETPKSSGG